jgi:hypothetical protein
VDGDALADGGAEPGGAELGVGVGGREGPAEVTAVGLGVGLRVRVGLGLGRAVQVCVTRFDVTVCDP